MLDAKLVDTDFKSQIQLQYSLQNSTLILCYNLHLYYEVYTDEIDDGK